MPRLLRTLATALTVSLAIACASKEFDEPGTLNPPAQPTNRVYKASYTAVWNSALAAIRTKKFAVSSAQRESGMIVTDWIMGKSDKLYSGYGETRIPYNIRSKFTLRLQPSRSGVNVVVTNDEQYYSDAVTAGTDFGGSLYQWIPTKSSSAKEAAILDEIGVQLANVTSEDESH